MVNGTGKRGAARAAPAGCRLGHIKCADELSNAAPFKQTWGSERSSGTQLVQDCARPSLEERKSCRRRLKLLTGARAGVRPAGKGLATSRERVLRGAVATRPAKRRQRSLRPCD